jgi:23S rRNA (guanosine2251-2'-O)-methyltransferase
MVVFGIHPVLEALRAGRVTELLVAGRGDERLRNLVRLAEREHARIRKVSVPVLDRVTKGGAHQGVAAEIRGAGALSLEELVAGRPATEPQAGPCEQPLIVVLDGIEDPHNVGAILRTVDAAGATGVVRQSRRAAPLGGAAAKVSAGALAHVRVAEVVNVAQALEALKSLGLWTLGLAENADTRYDDVDLTLPTALVVGAEGSGLRRLVRERCDRLVSIPMRGHVQSLNVSVATAVALFEAVRQRTRARLSNQPAETLPRPS